MKKIATLTILFLALTQCLFAQKFNEYFIDSTDNKVDVSGFLNSNIGFLPIPTIITEPAVGYGAGIAAVYFHNKKKREGEERKGDLPPIMSAAFGAFTQNGTWMGFLAHQGSYKKDRYRYTGAIGYMSINLDYYERLPDEIELKLAYNLQGFVTFHEFLMRAIKDVPFFLGANYLYFNNNVTFDLGVPQIPNFTEETNLGGLNFVTFWDTRNNTFTPTKGLLAAIDVGGFSPAFGGDNEYYNFQGRAYGYVPIVKDKLFSGYRMQFHSKWGGVPFFELPYVKLRGIPAVRYQAANITTVETEWRYQPFFRWSIVAFAGLGNAVDNMADMSWKNTYAAGGGGFRYFLARDYGIHAGIDVAKGPEQWAWYITVGSNWLR